MIVEQQSVSLSINTAEFEHPEMDPVRVLIPEDFEQEVMRRILKSPKEGHFAIAITVSKVLNHFCKSAPIATVTKYIIQVLECQLKKTPIHKIQPQVSTCSPTKQIIQLCFCI